MAETKYGVVLTATDKTKAVFNDAKKNAAGLEKEYGKIRSTVNGIGQAITGAVAGVAGASALFVKSTAEQAAEIDRLSALSNVATDEFQRYAAGAQIVGVEQGKLADIFKDTNDKIGDFLQTGGGPLKDFFENIAPQIGVTAEQFRNLSGPQALELYVSSLEDANVSQNEMTFFMEAVASDATILLPLLRDNAEGFKTLGDEAAAAGAIMSNDTIKTAQELNAVMLLMDETTEGLKNQIRQGTLPVVRDLALSFADLSENEVVADGATDLINSTLKGLTSTAIGAYASVNLLGKGLGGLAAIIATGGDAYDIVVDDLKADIQQYADLLNQVDEAGQGKVSDEKIKSIVDIQNKIRDALGQTSPGTNLSLGAGESGEIDKARSSLEKLQDSLNKQVDTFGLGETAVLRYRLTFGDLADEVNRLGSDGQEFVDSILEQSRALQTLEADQEAVKAAGDAWNESRERGIQLAESVLTPLEQFNEEVKEYSLLLSETHISQDTFNRLVAESKDSFEEATEGLDEYSEFAVQSARNIHDAFVDVFLEIPKGGIDDFADNFIRQIDRIAYNILAQRSALALFGSGFSETGKLGADGFISQGLDFASNLFSDFSFDGGGFTGSGPRSGGMDGKGGFPAILHPNETVVDHTKGQSTNSQPSITLSPTYYITANDARSTRQSVDQANAKLVRDLNHARRNM